MIKYIEGDILDFPDRCNVILQMCNCQQVMGSGLALSIKIRYPEAYEADKEAAKHGENRLGEFSRCKIISGVNKDKIILNLYGQFHYGREGRFINYESFYRGLELIREFLEDRIGGSCKTYRLGIPYNIGCGAAGGSWIVVEAMIKTIFENSKTNVIIIKLI